MKIPRGREKEKQLGWSNLFLKGHHNEPQLTEWEHDTLAFSILINVAYLVNVRLRQIEGSFLFYFDIY